MNQVRYPLLCLLLVAVAAPLNGPSHVHANEARTFRHVQGTTQIADVPQRVVVMDLAALDALDALGIAVVGVPDMDPNRQWPEYLQKYTGDAYTKCGSLFEPDLTVVKQLKPDLIIVGGRSSRQLETLSTLAPTIDLSTSTTAFVPSIAQNVLTLGAIFQVEEKANHLATKLLHDVRTLHDKAANQGSGLLLFSVGDRVMPNEPASRFGVVYELIGIHSVVAIGELPQRRRRSSDEAAAKTAEQIAIEKTLAEKEAQQADQAFQNVLGRKPAWIFAIDRNSAFGERDNAQPVLEANALVTDSAAWKSGKVVYLSGTGWYLIGGGPQQVQSTMTQINAAFDAAAKVTN